MIKDKRVLIVDDVDDTRTSLSYIYDAVKELGPSDIGTFENFYIKKNIDINILIGIAVIHNKIKPKKMELKLNLDRYYKNKIFII
jgi:hypoxanthine phosphoribosyltransferase